MKTVLQKKLQCIKISQDRINNIYDKIEVKFWNVEEKFNKIEVIIEKKFE